MYFLTGIQPSSMLTLGLRRRFYQRRRYCLRIRLSRATVLPDFDGPRKMPVHGARGATGSEGCLLLYSVVGNSLIFPFLCVTSQSPGEMPPVRRCSRSFQGVPILLPA